MAWGGRKQRRATMRRPLNLTARRASCSRLTVPHILRWPRSFAGWAANRKRNGTSQLTRRMSQARDRKSTRLNSSHGYISYAVFCLKKTTETITSIILIKLIRVSLGTVRHPRRFKIVVIDIQINLKQMLRDYIGIRVNRAKKSGMVNITSSVNSQERSGINTNLHELNPFFFINVTITDIKTNNLYSTVNS